MHMVHDFEAFTSETPTTTLAQFELLFREQIAAIRSGALAATDAGDSRLIL
jgi:hypothetical protein